MRSKWDSSWATSKPTTRCDRLGSTKKQGKQKEMEKENTMPFKEALERPSSIVANVRARFD